MFSSKAAILDLSVEAECVMACLLLEIAMSRNCEVKETQITFPLHWVTEISRKL